MLRYTSDTPHKSFKQRNMFAINTISVIVFRIAGLVMLIGAMSPWARSAEGNPNVVFVFADQWRAQATGFAGDPNAHTPELDKLAADGLRFTTAVSSCPVCSPYRASLITGRYPLTTGVFLNDVLLNSEAVSIAEAYKGAGYHTGGLCPP